METKKTSGLGIVGLVFGIIGMFLSIIFIGIVPCLIGFSLSVISLTQKDKKHGTAIAGIIFSVIGIMLFSFLYSLSENDEEITNTISNNTENVSESIESDVLNEIKNESEDQTDESISGDEGQKEDSSQEVKPEILFRDIQWGTNYTTVDEELSELNLMNISGESFKTMSCDDIALGDYNGIDFEYGDINIIANALNGEIDIAGYTTCEVSLYFSYIPVDGVLTKEENDSSLYGAQYVFEPMGLDEMSVDLLGKLSSLYGEPDKTIQDEDIWENKYTYTYWYGSKETEVVMRTQDSTDDTIGFYEDEIVISYIWRKGDELLQTASDTLKEEAIRNESEVYGNKSTDGL